MVPCTHQSSNSLCLYKYKTERERKTCCCVLIGTTSKTYKTVMQTHENRFQPKPKVPGSFLTFITMFFKHSNFQTLRQWQSMNSSTWILIGRDLEVPKVLYFRGFLDASNTRQRMPSVRLSSSFPKIFSNIFTFLNKLKAFKNMSILIY